MFSQAVSRLRQDAEAQGFELLGIAPADPGNGAGDRLLAFVELGRHGDMAWMAETAERRSHPNKLWPEARSVIMLGMNYGPERSPLEVLEHRERAAISVYARGRDYHDVIKGKLKTIAGRFAAASGADVKVFVDTAPVMEKPLAEAAGIGWQGKHTNLVSRAYGSWLFLGAIFTDAELPADAPEQDHCGSCRACLDICPTSAFPAPYQLDARRCISYLTIEHKGHIPEEFRAAIGNRVYGCDDCLAVCPWNKFARTAAQQKLLARPELDAPALADLLGLDDTAFRARFSGTAVKRTGHERFLRNVLIAAGNSGDASLIAHVRPHLGAASPLLRAMAVWALSRLMEPEEFSRMRGRFSSREDDVAVQREWSCAA